MLNRSMIWRTGIALGVLAAPALAFDVGDPAPEVRADRWYNAPGNVSLENYRGQVVVVDFWATYCHPCHEVQPKLAKLHQKWAPQGVVLISMSDEPTSVVEPFISKHPASYIMSAGGDTPRRYGITGIPAAFVIDRSGTICWRGNPHSGMFDDAIERAVRAPGKCVNGGAAPTSTWSAPKPASGAFESPGPVESEPESLGELPPARPIPVARSFEGGSTRTVNKTSVASKKSTPDRKPTATNRKDDKKTLVKVSKTSRKAVPAKPDRSSTKAPASKPAGKKAATTKKPVSGASRKRK